jgi:hypothetical protein
MNIFEFVQFDESRFEPVANSDGAYHRYVKDGYERMRQSTVVIAGLARNVSHVLPATILRMESLGLAFKSYEVVIYENDSSDHTKQLLEAWASLNSRVHLVCEHLEAPVNRPIRCSSRAKWMCYYRNCVQKYVLQNLPTADYVILLDTDLTGGWSVDGIANTIGQSNWDFVGSNGMIYKRRGFNSNRLIHYDAWAYRVDREMTPIPTCKVNAIRHRRGEPMVPLPSCFGGLGIYTYDAFRNGTYEGEDIEHVGFHRSLIRDGLDRLFINPSQIVLYGRKDRRLDKYFHGLQQNVVARRVLRCQPWMFCRRIDFSHWGIDQLKQMLESSRTQLAHARRLPSAA